MSGKNSEYHDFESLMLIDWRKASEGDLTRLRISGGSEIEDIEAWNSIIEQKNEVFGFSTKMKYYRQAERRLTMLRMELIETGERFLLNEIQVLEEEMRAIFSDETGGQTIEKTLIQLSERMRILLTEEQIKAQYFFSLLEHYSSKENGKKD